MTEEEALKIATHRHYKGGLYEFIALATHTETNEELAVYKHIWPHKQRVFVRPATMFFGDVTIINENGGISSRITRRFDPL